MLNEEHRKAFQEDGVIHLRGVFRDWVGSLRAGVRRNLDSPGAFARIYHDDRKRRYLSDYCNWQTIGEFESFVRYSECAEIAADLMGSTTARFFHEHVLVKEVSANLPTPWHHDQPYYCVDGDQNVSVWVALDPVGRNSSVEFVAGSHKWGKWYMPKRFNDVALYPRDADYEALPDIDDQRDSMDIRGFDLEPGDAICFNFLTIHGAPGNQSGTHARRAVSFRWIGDDARYAKRPGPTSPPFPDLKLAPGDEMDAPEFPLLWPSPDP